MNETASKSRVTIGWKLWVLIFVAATLLYALTAKRGVAWQDSGAYQWRAMHGEFIRDVPLCRSHPTYIAVGWGVLKASGNNLTLLNVFSGLAAAMAMANLAAVGVLLTNRRTVTLIAVTALGLSHTFWWLATIAETYTLTIALMTLNLYLLVKFDQTSRRRFFYALVFVSGLGVSVHNFALLPIPIYFVYFVFMTRDKKLRLADWFLAAAIWTAGAAPLISITIYKAATQNISLPALLQDVFTGPYDTQVFNLRLMSRFFKPNAALTALNGFNLLWIPAIIGVWTLIRITPYKTKLSWVIIGITLIEIIFFARYFVPDQFMFVLPSMVMITLLGCVGLGQIVRWGVVGKIVCGAILLFGLLQIPMYMGISRILSTTSYAERKVSSNRDEIRYWIIPWKHNENSAENWATAVMNNVPEGSTIHADTTTKYTLKLKNFLNPSVKVIRSKPDYEEIIQNPDKVFFVYTYRPKLPAPWVVERISPDIKLFRAKKDAELKADKSL